MVFWERTVARATRMQDAALFFLPLILMSEMMMASHSIIHAFLARQASPKIILAGFNVAFSIQTLLAGFVASLPMLAISYLSDRPSFFRLLRFGWIAALLGSAFMLLAALTTLGDVLFGRMIGASAAVTAEARNASLLFALILPLVVVRQVSMGLIMRNRKTVLITIATLIRLIALIGFLALFSFLFEGAAAGAAALALGIAVETFFMGAMAMPFFLALPKGGAPVTSYREIWQFAWPLFANQMGENGLPLVINFFLGRLFRADLALAAFGVMRGLVNLLAGPVRSLAQTTQALVATREDMGVLLRFTVRVALGFAGLVILLFYTPLRGVVLEGVMGLSPELSGYIAPAMLVAVIVPLFWSFTATFRGLLAAAKRTRMLAISAGFRVALIAAVGSVTLALPEVNGAVVGIVAMVCALGAEVAILGGRLYFGERAGELFPSLGEELAGK